MFRPMTTNDSAGRPTNQDIPAGLVWIACAALYALLVAVALVDRAILEGPPTALGRNHELGLLESLQNVFLLVALVLMLLAAMRAQDAALRGWLLFIALGTFWLLGEETSWGQHYFNWQTGGWFAAINDQGETNIHNTPGGWFDQKPRAILLFGMILGAVAHPLVKWARNGRGLFDKPAWLAPTLASLPPVVFSQIGALPERIDDLNDALQLWSFRVQEVLQYRSSEMEEVFMYLFFITYTLSLSGRFKLRRQAAG